MITATAAQATAKPGSPSTEAGTLVLDVRDARTNRVVWRSSAQQSVDGLIDNQDWMEKYIEKAVARMMEQFPRAGMPQGRPVAGNR